MRTQTLPEKLRAILLPAGGTLIVLLLFWGIGTWIISRSSHRTPSFLPTASPPSGTLLTNTVPDTVVVPQAEQDSDRDGLSDTLEELYKTDPRNPDSDSDGYNDGQEVANGYDPTIPSPNDKVQRLSPSPGTTNTVPTSSAVNFTQQYVNSTGKPLTKEGLLSDKTALATFVQQENARGYLPEVSEDDIHLIDASGKEAVKAYLEHISIPQNKKLQKVDVEDITTAFNTYVKSKNDASLKTIIGKLQNNLTVIRGVDVPAEAVDIHTKYLSGTQALLINTQALLSYQQDYVGSLVAASRIEDLRTLFRDIEKGIQSLEKTYNIT